MRRAVVADLHVGEHGDDLPRFLGLCRQLAERQVDEVVFLGDLFRTLVGYARFWDDTVRAGLGALAMLREGGRRIVMVEGNRDFFLDSADLDPYRDASGVAHSFASGGRRFLLEHGDLVNRGDRQYRMWRSISKSGTARLWARLLPRRLASRLVRGTEERLAQTNFAYRRVLPVADLEARARRYFDAGVDVVLWGHFHRPWRFATAAGEAFAVPAWEDTGTVVWIDGEGGMTFEPTFPAGHFVDSKGVSWYQEATSTE
ncbi:MAG: UDP-2,3-diacylglucosamine diphosphatase [Acidobacteriota bacterium]